MLDLQILKFSFSAEKGKQQEQILTQTVGFASPVRIANAAINGFNIGFIDADHHFRGMEIDVSTSFVTNTALNVTLKCLLTDINFDDPYFFVVDVLVIADRA
jgi:hypothetical protein